MALHVVGPVSSIPPGGRKLVEIAGRSIGVFNLGGEFFALRNRCPHQGAELCTGPLGGQVASNGPGDYQLTRSGEILRCPWHGWEFDVRTGQSWFDPGKVRVKRYETTVGKAAMNPPVPGMEPGPYVAESYRVTVEEDVVMVDL